MAHAAWNEYVTKMEDAFCRCRSKSMSRQQNGQLAAAASHGNLNIHASHSEYKYNIFDVRTKYYA